MASSFRLPAGSIAYYARPGTVTTTIYAPSPVQCRTFSQSSQRWAYRSTNFSPPSMAQPSLKTRSRDAMSTSQMPNDIGLLPGTFVRPLWRDLPSIFQSPKDRWLMEWTWMKTLFQSYISLLIYCKKDNRLPMQLRERRKIARELYVDMYNSFASGDARKLRSICCDGLANKLTAQIEDRPANEKIIWKLVKWLRQPSTYGTGVRVMSDRATQIPEMSKSGIRQIVLRVNSRQSMHKEIKTLGSRPGQRQTEMKPAKQQDCLEHIVIQEIRWNDKSTGWRIWGTVKPTDLDTVYTDPYFAPGLSAMERMQAMKDAAGQ
ncbi:hypothetical protein N7492_007747 [Penicillium capsulatum]|uniref:Tim44-like domain-containing protein n=1 Tax=Penicillium capsulatum TaxID=69766 RepID=A0A9W9I5Q5_9EURO|nr:hypothetical protein N7492_007747 [Penicillium capsulatum]KAJ6117579.1 hypothetical protein N7512_007304 [Penicillium capsulatum]